MVVDKEKMVSLTYKLRLNDENGEVVETVTDDKPLTFLYGSGRLLQSFEENLNGLAAGDNFKFTLTSSQAYGDVDNNAIVDVPKGAFEVNGSIDENMLQVGNTIPMQDGAGNRLNGRVKEITNEVVKMDFNHPLAGENLHFEGEVHQLRDATPEEIAGESSCGCSSCGCGDGEEASSCGDGGCGDGCC